MKGERKVKGDNVLLLPERFYSLNTIVGLLLMIAIKIITVYTAVTSLSSHQKFSISRLICFRRVYLPNKRGGRKPWLFSLNF